MSVDTSNKNNGFDPIKSSAVLNTTKAKNTKSNYNKYRLSMPRSKRSMKTGVYTHTSSKNGLFSTNRSMKLMSTHTSNISAMTTMQVDIETARDTLTKVDRIREKAENENDEDAQLVLLNKENIMLRDELKNLNNGLSKFIEFIKKYKLRKQGKPRYGNENYTVDYKLRSRDNEEKNYKQIIYNLTQEYRRFHWHLN